MMLDIHRNRSNPKRVLHVVGARPNFMKVAPIMREMARYPSKFEQILAHTGQHYDDNMSEAFFRDLELPRPDIYLGVGSGSHAQQTARIMLAFDPVLMEHRPDWVIVVGDVNSTVACALTAVKRSVKVAHVEAGLRSFDRTMPEEINRVITDHIADLLFTSEPSGSENLRKEGIPQEKIRFVGNVMIDTLVQLLPKAKSRPVLAQLDLLETKGQGTKMGGSQGKGEMFAGRRRRTKDYVLVTLHRPSNVDESGTLRKVLLALNDIAQEWPVIFPAHPRTRQRIAEFGLDKLQPTGCNLKIIEPLGYLDFLALQAHARLVITDSGGVQEETTFLGVPCLTARPNTERPVTITQGTNRLVASERVPLLDATRAILTDSGRLPSSTVKRPKLWDGHAAERIVAELREIRT